MLGIVVVKNLKGLIFFPYNMLVVMEESKYVCFSSCHSSSQEIIDKHINWARNYARMSSLVIQNNPIATVAHWSASSRVNMLNRWSNVAK